MNEQNIETLLVDQFCQNPNVARVETFEASGVLTRDSGVLVSFESGDEFQITIVQSMRGDNEEEEEK